MYYGFATPSSLTDVVEMAIIKPAWLIVLALGCVEGAVWGQDKPQPKRQIERAKRPTFNERDWDGVYFENLFDQGLVGSRPENFGRKIAPSKPVALSANGDGEAAALGAGWSQWISGQALEDEVKKTHLELDALITTPQNFKTENGKIRECFSRLATWFGIIAEYDDSVRWKADATFARDAFAQAAANARTSSDEAFANAKSQRDQLAELIRGGKLSSNSSAATSVEMNWTHWVDRVAMMTRLEAAFTERLKPWTSNAAEFAGHSEEVLHEANLVAAIGNTLLQVGLEDADDDEYMRHAREMTAAAKSLQEALQTNQFEAASSAVNRLGQACSNCHEAFR